MGLLSCQGCGEGGRRRGGELCARDAQRGAGTGRYVCAPQCMLVWDRLVWGRLVWYRLVWWTAAAPTMSFILFLSAETSLAD